MKIDARKTCSEEPHLITSGQRQSANAVSALLSKGGFWCHAYNGKFTSDTWLELFRLFQKNRKLKAIPIVDGHPIYKLRKVMKYIESLAGKLKIVAKFETPLPP